MSDLTPHDYCMQQIDAAQHGRADNQCPSCGVYRTDGQPPRAHRASCDRDRNPLLHPYPTRGAA
jgi:hypothetical protein